MTLYSSIHLESVGKTNLWRKVSILTGALATQAFGNHGP